MGRRNRLDSEIEFHLEQQTEKNIRAGMSPEEARRAAVLKFGGIERTREATRDEFQWTWLADYARDLKIGMRTLGRMPAFAISAILTIALGIGAATAMFSVFQGVLIRPLPYPDADRIVRLYQLGETGARGNVSEPNYNDWREGTQSFGGMAEMASYGAVPISGAGDGQLARLSVVSREFFEVMGVQPSLGRNFLPEELQPGGPPVAIVSAEFWRRWRGTEAPRGEVLRSGNTSFAVVGVMPEGFNYPAQTTIWAPREANPPQTSRTAHNFQVVARLAAGVSVEQAQLEISALSRRLKQDYQDETWMFDAAAVPLLEVVTSTSKGPVQLLFLAAVLLLLVACTNASNLFVVRAAARRSEFAVQLAMGATPGRLARQLMAEAQVVCLAGAALGVAGAAGAVNVFVAMGPASVERLDAVVVSWPAVAFAVVGAMVAAMGLSVITAQAARGVSLAEVIAESTRSGTGSRKQMRMREGLIVIQVALTLVLLAGATLLARSLQSAMAVEPGYSLDEGLIVGITTTSASNPAELAQQVAFQDEVVAGLRAQPGVTGVGLTSVFPLAGGTGGDGTFIEMTRPDEITSFDQFDLTNPVLKARSGSAEYRQVSADYFAAMRIPILQGRVVDDRDTPTSPHVAVISQSLADTRWPGQDPIGRWIQFGNMDGDLRAIQIVGVVGDVREVTPEAMPSPTLYVSARQRPFQASRASVIVRGPAAEELGDAVRRIVRDLDPDVPVTVTTMETALNGTFSGRRFTLWLVGAFSLSALGLATLGIYGLIAYAVAQRSREMGIRMALGAEPRALVWLVVRRGLVLALVGTSVGLIGSRVAAGALEGLLYGVTPGDPVTFVGAALILIGVTVMASYGPARRLLRQSPATTLRP